MANVILAQATEDAAALVGGLGFLLFGIVLLILAFCWVILPFIIMAKMSRMQEVLVRISAQIADRRQLDIISAELQSANQHLLKLAARNSFLSTSTAARGSGDPVVTGPPARSEPQFYFVRNGETQGPIGETKLRSLYNAGAIDDETLAMREGQSDWSTARVLLS